MNAWRAQCLLRHSVVRIQQKARCSIRSYALSRVFSTSTSESSSVNESSDVEESLQERSIHPDFIQPVFTAYDEFDAPIDPGIYYVGKADRGLLSPLYDRNTQKLLVELEQLKSLDECLATLSEMILKNGSALQPDNYSYIIRVLYKHAGFRHNTREHSLDPSQIDNYCAVLMGVWASSVAFNQWQLSTRSYGCLIYLLAHFNNPGAFQIYYALHDVETVILDDSTYGSLMAMAFRIQEYGRVVDLWLDMTARYKKLRHAFNKPEHLLQTEWRWTDEKQKEFHYLMANVPCQQMWMYHYALQSAQWVRQTRHANTILAQLFRWEETYTLAQRKLMNPDLIAPDDGSSILNDSLLSNRLVVMPLRTAVTYQLMITQFCMTKNMSALMQTLDQMGQLDIKLTDLMVQPILKLLITTEQFESLFSLMCYVEKNKPLLTSQILTSIIQAMLKREHFERANFEARFADASRQQIIRLLNSFHVWHVAKGETEITKLENHSLMLLRLRDMDHEHPQHIIFLTLFKASLMLEDSHPNLDLWISSEDFQTMGVGLSSLTIWGARATTCDAFEPDVLARLNSRYSDPPEHLIYISPAQIRAFQAKLAQSFPSEPTLNQSTADWHIRSRIASRYLCFWQDLVKPPPIILSSTLGDFFKVWSLHLSSTLIKSMSSTSPYTAQKRLGFVSARKSAIVNAVQNLCDRRMLFLPPQLALDYASAIDSAVYDSDEALLNLVNHTSSTACAATYIFLEFVTHFAPDSTRPLVLYVRSDSLQQLETVRTLLQHHTTLVPVYLSDPTPAELSDAGVKLDDSIPLTSSARLREGHPTKFRRIKRVTTLRGITSRDKSDLKNVLMIPCAQLALQGRPLSVDHIQLANDIAKQFDREQSVQPSREQSVQPLRKSVNGAQVGAVGGLGLKKQVTQRTRRAN